MDTVQQLIELADSDRFEAAYDQAIFCAAILITVLQTELGVRYSRGRIDEPYEFRDSRDRFTHGITHGDGGTCMTLPVLLAALGRRLENPIKLAKGTIHVFCRWDGRDRSLFPMNDTFNIEATAPGIPKRAGGNPTAFLILAK